MYRSGEKGVVGREGIQTRPRVEVIVANRAIRDMDCWQWRDEIIGVSPESGSPFAAYACYEITLFEVVLLVWYLCLERIGEYLDSESTTTELYQDE